MDNRGGDPYMPGDHHIEFAIRMPSRIESGTFYHTSD
jgi:hypothetical protein